MWGNKGVGEQGYIHAYIQWTKYSELTMGYSSCHMDGRSLPHSGTLLDAPVVSAWNIVLIMQINQAIYGVLKILIT